MIEYIPVASMPSGREQWMRHSAMLVNQPQFAGLTQTARAAIAAIEVRNTRGAWGIRNLLGTPKRDSE
jgi:hypothetical protein